MKQLIESGLKVIDHLGLWLGLLGLRLILGWEYFESGWEKFRGENWFADIQARFPFPFNLVPTDISWQMATWLEIVGGVALVIGIGTRIFGTSLFILTIVAIASVHWPDSWATMDELLQGYALTDKGQGNYKLPVIFLVMLLPLILAGPGRLSIDALVRRTMIH